tara:strand:+ start:210 stop:368 length:159 start_codon:yes stop_codon:yes gene_type:complete
MWLCIIGIGLYEFVSYAIVIYDYFTWVVSAIFIEFLFAVTPDALYYDVIVHF